MRRNQTGASLIEAMIALLIIGLGLLGLGAMQTKAISLNQSAYYRSIAADLGTDLADRIRAIRTPFLASTDANPQPNSPPDFSLCVQNGVAAPTCSSQTNGTSYEALANSEMTAWNALRISQLPAGSTYTLTQVQSGTSNYYRYTLTLNWLDDRNSGSTASYSVVIE